MNGNGAYRDEMNEVVLFEKALRAAIPSRPDPGLGAELVPRLAQAARASTLEIEGQAARRGSSRSHGTGRRRRARIARVALIVAALPLMLAGLAFAGVTMPSPVRSVFNSAGVHLPNQPSTGHATRTTPASGRNSSQSESVASPHRTRGSHRQAKHTQNHSAAGNNPGRRVRRHGNGPVPGPASAPQGNALGHLKPHGNSQNHSSGSSPPASPGNSASAPGQTGVHSGGAANGHGKPG